MCSYFIRKEMTTAVTKGLVILLTLSARASLLSLLAREDELVLLVRGRLRSVLALTPLSELAEDERDGFSEVGVGVDDGTEGSSISSGIEFNSLN